MRYVTIFVSSKGFVSIRPRPGTLVDRQVNSNEEAIHSSRMILCVDAVETVTFKWIHKERGARISSQALSKSSQISLYIIYWGVDIFTSHFSDFGLRRLGYK